MVPWPMLILATTLIHQISSAYVSQYDLMKCSYGERGSLTAICVNATSGYFKNTPYRFDQLDETLRCVNCSLRTIETGTFDISGNMIKALDLTKSQIEMLKQKAFIGLIFLEKLYLTGNFIRSIYPGTFTGVKKIKEIDLSANDINILSDDGFLELVNLEVLNLEHNQIQTVAPRAFNGLLHLKQLNLRSNKISDVKDVFGNITSLEILNLEYNEIYSLNGSEFYNLTSLLELNLAHNKLHSVRIEIDPQNQLRNLFLQSNLIDTILPDFLRGAHALESLDLSYNQLAEINQKELLNMYNLRRLNLTFNKLNSFQTGVFSGLPQLELLNCSHNEIIEIQITGVFSLHSLHTLDLSHNAIYDLDYLGLVSRLPKLSYLRMEDNKLPCDLEKDMDEYFAEDNFKYVLYDNVVGSVKCIDVPLKRNRASIPDTLLGDARPASKGPSGGEVTIFVLISIVFVCIGFLFYLQYRTYQQLRYSSPRRTTSAVHLIASEEQQERDDYLKE